MFTEATKTIMMTRLFAGVSLSSCALLMTSFAALGTGGIPKGGDCCAVVVATTTGAGAGVGAFVVVSCAVVAGGGTGVGTTTGGGKTSE